VQAQLTDNSWLLYPTVRLTGGFAFATWFSGPNLGQFVLTLGGYNPYFHRDGYPVVPRLGVDWKVSNAIAITGEAYLALTSEAVMAGTRIEASCDFGPAWASLVLGADGIIFFDPFWMSVTVYAAISAGVTVDVWVGEIDIEVSLTARVTVEGPPFHARASFSVGPVDLVVEFGDRPTAMPALTWEEFVPKYLEQAEPGVAKVLTTVTGAGTVPPAGSATTGGASSSDGSESNPFRVSPEFELTITSTVPVCRLVHGSHDDDLPTSTEIAVAPMRADATPVVTLQVNGPREDSPADHVDRLEVVPQQLGAYAIGTFGPAQDAGNPKVPAGQVISAVDRVLLRGTATVATSSGGAPAIKYRQVETSARRVNPFVVETTPQRRNYLLHAAEALAGFVPSLLGGQDVVDVAAELLTTRAGRSPADAALWAGERTAEPILGSLAEGLGQTTTAVSAELVRPEGPAPARAPRPPVIGALLSAPTGSAPAGEAMPLTTVSMDLIAQLREEYGSVPPRMSALQLSDVDAHRDPTIPARLLRTSAPAVDRRVTVVAGGQAPITRTGHAGVETIGGRGGDRQAAARLDHLRTALLGEGLDLGDGDVAVLRSPDADRDVARARRPRVGIVAGRVRVVLLRPGARVMADAVLDGDGALDVPPGVRTVVLVAGPPALAGAVRVSGWVAQVPAPYVGDQVWLGAGCVAQSASRIPSRGLAFASAGWIAPDRLVAGDSAATTRFAAPARVLAVELGGGAGLDDIALGIEGAHRAVGRDGRDAAPVVVSDGSRTVLVFDLAPPAAGPAGPFTATVVTAASRRLTAVAAAAGRLSGTHVTAESFAAAIAGRGLAALVPPVTVDGQAHARVQWKEPSP
jgi:hypothetical protein